MTPRKDAKHLVSEPAHRRSRLRLVRHVRVARAAAAAALLFKAVETEAGQAAERQQHLSSAGSDERSGKDFWAVNVYHAGTAAFHPQLTGRRHRFLQPKAEEERQRDGGRVFRPQALEGQESNWVMTSKGKPFFMMFRFTVQRNGPSTGSWVLNNIDK